MDKIRKVIKVIYGLIFAVLLVIIIAVLASYFSIGGFKLYTVQSGSMEPSIHVGSVVADTQARNYIKGDIISFSPNNNRSNIVSHRIYAITNIKNKIYYVTKGDANRTPDVDAIQKSMILGKVIFSIPFLGYPIAFARTQTGLIILIIIPATLIIYSEVINIKNEIVKMLKKRNEKKTN